MLTLAADTIHELSQPTPSSEKVDYKTKDFLKTVEVLKLDDKYCDGFKAPSIHHVKAVLSLELSCSVDLEIFV